MAKIVGRVLLLKMPISFEMNHLIRLIVEMFNRASIYKKEI